LGGVGHGYNVSEPAGEWWVFNVTAAAGETIYVKALHQDTTGSMLSIVAFDPIPEPSSMILLATGLFALLAYAWRKRK